MYRSQRALPACPWQVPPFDRCQAHSVQPFFMQSVHLAQQQAGVLVRRGRMEAATGKFWRGVSTCIAEDPRGDVGACAHDVFHVQTGLQPSLALALVPNHLVNLRAVGKAAAKELHELSQVSLVEILLQELGGQGTDKFFPIFS